MNDLPEQINQTIQARGLFPRGQKILVAVSGGVDSMVLLHVLHAFAKRHRWQITVAHLNHQLRGRSSGADERLVARVAKKLRVPIVSARVEVKKIARAGKLSLEMAARKVRHEFLAQTAARLKISHVALAHHADDQVELFFLRLFRGTGSEGLAGMKWRSPSPADKNIQLIRPLLEETKDSVRDYAALQKIPFREDASNECLDIQRNRIRRELLPLLRRKYQPALRRTVRRLMEILRAESELITDATEEWLASGTVWQSGVKCFANLPVAIQRRSIQAQLLRHGIPTDFGLIERLRTLPERRFTIMPHSTDETGATLPCVTVRCDADGRLHFHQSEMAASNPARLEVCLEAKPREALFGGKRISWAVAGQKMFCLPEAQTGKEYFDADKVGSRIVLRHWQPGDRFQPIGMARAVKLQDFFVNQKIPRARRHDLIVATTARNEVFWVENLRISERFKLTPQTTRRLTWQWK